MTYDDLSTKKGQLHHFMTSSIVGLSPKLNYLVCYGTYAENDTCLQFSLTNQLIYYVFFM